LVLLLSPPLLLNTRTYVRRFTREIRTILDK
jgi:hypothetical protein